MNTTLLVGIFAIALFLLYREVSKSTDSESFTRDLLEGLRRDLLDTKDKLSEGMGKNAEHVQQRLEKTLDLVNQQLGGMDNRIDKRVSEINQRLDSATKLMSMVQKQYGTVEELSGSIKNLQEAFKAPKPRGGFGERTLVDLVNQVLPIQSYEAQHTFRSGSIVDLLVKTASGDICIDAKFPLENYLKLVDQPEDMTIKKAFRTDVKKHVRDVAKKYILPEEGTLEFALLFVPSDAVWHEIITDHELSDLAQDLQVFVLSPQSFYYFLNVIRLAYQSQTFEENAKKVLALLRAIQQQNSLLGTDLKVLQRHVGNASAKMGDVQSSYDRLDMRITQVDQISLTSPKTPETVQVGS